MIHHPLATRRLWMFGFITAGLSLFIVGFVYDVMFAGIPYQDPTPEMSARYTRHASVASAIRWCGAGVFLIGLLMGIVRLFARKVRSPVVA